MILGFIPPDLLTLAIWFVGFILIGLLIVFEGRAMAQRTPTISAFMHKHPFGTIFAIAWSVYGLGVLTGHFVSGSIYCGTP